MGHLNCIGYIKDLPSDKVLLVYLKEAAGVNKEKIKVVRKKLAPKKELPLPEKLSAAFKKNKKAMTIFDAFRPSQRREHIEWINEAKTDETLNKRLATTME